MPNLHIEQGQKSTPVALTFCISHISAAETPANLSLDYIPGSRMKGIAGRVSWNYVQLTPATEHGIQNIQTVKQACFCLQH